MVKSGNGWTARPATARQAHTGCGAGAAACAVARVSAAVPITPVRRRSARLPRPIVYQHTRGGRRRIAARYTDRGASEVGFAVAPYDRRAPLIIDPLVIIYSTFLGGSLPSPGINSDSVYGIAVNESAFAYVTGSTTSTDFPDDASSTFGGLQDAFVAKLAQGGSALVYSTFLGASFSQP